MSATGKKVSWFVVAAWVAVIFAPQALARPGWGGGPGGGGGGYYPPRPPGGGPGYGRPDPGRPDLQLEQALRLAYDLPRSLQYGGPQRALMDTQQIRGLLRATIYDRDIEQADRAAMDLEFRLNDYRLPPHVKLRAVEDGSRFIADLIQRSEAFRRGGGGYPQPPVPPGYDYPQELGGVFVAPGRPSYQTIFVGRHLGQFHSLELRVEGAPVHLQRMDIVFGNGRVQSVYGLNLDGRMPLRIDLNGNDRFIEQIRVIAAAAPQFGGSNVRISGVRAY
jgi:hypothetical protein